MRIRFAFTLAAITATLLTAAHVPAQNFGILVSITSATAAPRPLCGFDCADPAHIGRVTPFAGDRATIRLYGDTGSPAALLIAIGPPFACPLALPIPGFQNPLHLDPTTMLPIAPGVGALQPSLTSNIGCGSPASIASGSAIVASNVPLSATFIGVPISFQGLVLARGALTFTRPVELVTR